MKEVEQFIIGSDFHLDTRIGYDSKVLPWDFMSEDSMFLCAGDISPLHYYALWTPFVADILRHCGGFVGIPGNHEFYGGTLQCEPEHFDVNLRLMAARADSLRDFLGMVFIAYHTSGVGSNMFKTEHGHTVQLFSTTLWTDYNSGIDSGLARKFMADFGQIKAENWSDPGAPDRNINPDDVITLHEWQKQELFHKVRKSTADIKIVMTHHAPSYACVGSRFVNSAINSAFVNNFDYQLDDLGVDVWIHGHTHERVDTEVAGTRILCYPYGYPGENARPTLASLTFNKHKEPQVQEI